jgi:membrane protein
MIQAAVAETNRSLSQGLGPAVIGVLVLFLAGSSIFGELKNSLNSIWRAQPPPGGAIKNFVRDHLLSIALMPTMGFLLLVSLIASAAVAWIGNALSAHFLLTFAILGFADLVISLSMLTLLFATLFKILPDYPLRWRDVVGGSLLTAVLFTAGKTLLAWYLVTNTMASAFGAAGSLIVILLWFYYTTCILFFGAEFTRAEQHERNRGASSIGPASERISIDPSKT